MSTLPLKLRNRIDEIDSHTPPRQYIREILHAICDSLGYLFGFAIEIDDHGNEHMVSSFNLPKDYLEQVGSAGTPVLSSPSGEAVKTGKVVVLHNPLSDHRIAPWRDILRPYDIKAMVWVPLISGGRTFGTYVLYDTAIRDVSEEELQTLEQIALLISIAMGTNQRLDQPNYKTKELQRENTEHRQAEEALRARERGYRKLADLLPQIVFEMDLEGNFTFANRFAFASTGYTQEDLDKGVNAVQLFVPEERERVEQNMAAVLSGEMFDDHEYTCLRKDGSTFPVLIYSSRIIRGGESVGLRGIVLDITERKRAEEALRESEVRYRALFEGSAEGILVADIETKQFKYANPAMCRMLGYTEAELKRMGVVDIHPQDALEHVISEFEVQVRGEKTLAPEIPCLRKDGTTIYADIKSSNVLIGGKECNVGFFTDITERKRADEVLKESEEKFRTLAEQSPNMIYINKKGRIVWANRRCEEIMGYSREEFRSSDFDFLSLIAPDHRPLVKEMFGKYMKGEEVPPYEYALVNKQGKRIEAINSTRLIMYGGDKALLGIITDITERKQAEEELRLFLQAVDNSIDGIAMGDLEMRVTYVNEAFAKMFGYSREKLIGKEIASLYAKDHMPKLEGALKATMEGGWSGELVARRKDGELFPVTVSSSRVMNDDGKVIAHMTSQRDVTERKRIEAREKARLQLLNDLRTANNIDACLDCGCKAIYEARLFRRAVLTLHNDKKEIVNLGQVSLDKEVVQAARNAPAPDEELSKSMTQEKHRISHSYFIPEEAGLVLNESPRHISPTDHAERRDSSWKAGDELFVPIIGDDNKFEGWLSVDTPFDGERPTIEIVRFLEQVVDIVTQKVREIRTLEKLRQGHRALLESEERFRLISETIPDYIFEADKNGITTYFSKAIETILGYTPEERQGADYISFIASSDLSKAKTLFDKVIEGRVIRDLEINLLHKSGETVATEVSAAPVFKNDKVTNICGVVRDITERKRAEEALRESENRYKTLVENLPQRIFLKDKDSTYVSCNQNYARDLRIKPDEIAGKTDYEFVLLPISQAVSKRVLQLRL